MEQCFLWERGASVGADFDLFNFQHLWHAQQECEEGKNWKQNWSPLSVNSGTKNWKVIIFSFPSNISLLKLKADKDIVEFRQLKPWNHVLDVKVTLTSSPFHLHFRHCQYAPLMSRICARLHGKVKTEIRDVFCHHYISTVWCRQ